MRLPASPRDERSNAVSEASRRIPTVTFGKQQVPEQRIQELEGKSEVLESTVQPQQPESKTRSSRNDAARRRTQAPKEVDKLREA